MWRLAVELQPRSTFEPDLWIRKEGGHTVTTGTGCCWEYAGGTTFIDKSRTIIDFVNITGRFDYIVAAVREDGKDIPVPIGRLIPRH
jgi:hypothetical protein